MSSKIAYNKKNQSSVRGEKVVLERIAKDVVFVSIRTNTQSMMPLKWLIDKNAETSLVNRTFFRPAQMRHVREWYILKTRNPTKTSCRPERAAIFYPSVSGLCIEVTFEVWDNLAVEIQISDLFAKPIHTGYPPCQTQACTLALAVGSDFTIARIFG